MPSIGVMLVAAERHDRAFAELLFDRGDRVAELGAVFQDAGGLVAGAWRGFLAVFVGFGHTSCWAAGLVGDDLVAVATMNGILLSSEIG